MPDAIWAVDRYLPDFSRANEAHPVLTPSMHFSTRLQRFARARLLASHLTGSSPAFSSTLTTIALYDSSLRWFETHSCKPVSRGHPLISCAAQLLWKCLNHSSSFAPSWRTLIQMPAPLRIAAHVRDASLTNLGGEHRAKPVPPEPDGLVADVDPALGQQILDVAQRQRVSHVHHHDQTDDLWRAVEISERIAHAPTLTQPGQPENLL